MKIKKLNYYFIKLLILCGLLIGSLSCRASQQEMVFPVFVVHLLPDLFQHYKIDRADERPMNLTEHATEIIWPADQQFRKQDKEALSRALSTEANFAGRYRIVEWGCGTECQTGAIIELKTGKLVMLPTSEWGRLYRPDSRLLVENPPSDAEGSKHRPEYALPVYHLWQQGAWHLLCDTAKPDKCSGKVYPAYD